MGKNRPITGSWGLPRMSLNKPTPYDFSGKPLYSIKVPPNGLRVYPDFYGKFPVSSSWLPDFFKTYGECVLKITPEQLTELAKDLPSERVYDECWVDKGGDPELREDWYITFRNPDTHEWVDVNERSGDVIRYGNQEVRRIYDHRLDEHRLEIGWFTKIHDQLKPLEIENYKSKKNKLTILPH